MFRQVMLAIIVVSALSAAAYAQQATERPPGSAPAQAAVQATTSVVTQAAVQKGVFNCAGRINQVVNFLGFTEQAGAVLMIPPAQPDSRLIPLAMEIPVEGGVAYVSASFAPNQANGCGATYDSVVYWPQSCAKVKENQFKTLKETGKIRKAIAILDGGEGIKIFLMPAGIGCVSIKKDVVQ
ncbi:MAG: hypothetical protein CVU71_07980 [Deltaproteobacteria bacterium HGW-Deltaproteobacteria-6]|jgi:hypothetical protein|nr:MAG: hypothetical protein CVU71_07980 [Deltaproteobacteria bacterium HGW-Deltaproteobacteria-6]